MSASQDLNVTWKTVPTRTVAASGARVNSTGQQR